MKSPLLRCFSIVLVKSMYVLVELRRIQGRTKGKRRVTVGGIDAVVGLTKCSTAELDNQSPLPVFSSEPQNAGTNASHPIF